VGHAWGRERSSLLHAKYTCFKDGFEVAGQVPAECGSNAIAQYAEMNFVFSISREFHLLKSGG